VARVDLDARRAEAGNEPHVVVLDGTEYLIPAKLPLAVAERLVQGQMTEAIRGMFGDEHVETVADVLTLDDLLAIADECYGLRVGESAASSRPSPNGGTRSTPTSSASTG
jgi:hypothetical protein